MTPIIYRAAAIDDDELALFVRSRFATFLDQFSAAHRRILVPSVPNSAPLPDVHPAIQRKCD